MTFKEMPRDKKIEHIWEYYRFHIIGGILLVCLICSLVYSIFLTPQKDMFAGLGIYGEYVLNENIGPLTEKLNTSLGLDSDTTVDIVNFFASESDPVLDAEMDQKLNTYLYAQQLNILTANAESMNTFVNVEYIIPLTEVLTAEEIAGYDSQGLLLYAVDPADSIEKPFAISLKGTTTITGEGLLDENVNFVAVTPLYDKLDNSVQLLNQILK